MCKLVTVYSAFSPADVQLVKSVLEAAGLNVFVLNEDAALSMDGYSMAVGGIKLAVNSEDENEAREIINSVKLSS
jgi:hypothetical protein